MTHFWKHGMRLRRNGMPILLVAMISALLMSPFYLQTAYAQNNEDIKRPLDLSDPLDRSLRVELNNMDQGYALIGQPITKNSGKTGLPSTNLRWYNGGSSYGNSTEGIVLNRNALEKQAHDLMGQEPFKSMNMNFFSVLLSVCTVALAHERTHVLQEQRENDIPSKDPEGLMREAQADIFAGAWFSNKFVTGMMEMGTTPKPPSKADVEKATVELTQQARLLQQILMNLGDKTSAKHPSGEQRQELFARGLALPLFNWFVSIPGSGYSYERIRRELGFRFGEEKAWEWSWRVAQHVTGVRWNSGNKRGVIAAFVEELKQNPASETDELFEENDDFFIYWAHTPLPGSLNTRVWIPKEQDLTPLIRCLLWEGQDVAAAQAEFTQQAANLPVFLPVGWKEELAPTLSPEGRRIIGLGTWQDAEGKVEADLHIIKSGASYRLVLEFSRSGE